MPTANAKSRGYQKISAAARALKLDFRGQTVLDLGSSTGGFTQYALDNGAKKVIAVEKGTNQMSAPLRFDPRVELHEKTDLFNFRPTPVPDLILIDISFLPLTKVLKYANIYLTGSDTQLLVMLKPQFEATGSQLHKGIVKNAAIRRTIIKTFETWLKNHNFTTLAKRDAAQTGRFGNLERFYLLKPPKPRHGVKKYSYVVK